MKKHFKLICGVLAIGLAIAFTGPNASQIEGLWIATNGEKYIFADNGYFWTNKKGDLMHRGTFSLNGQRIILINQFSSFFGPWYPGTGQFIMDFNGTTIRSGSRVFTRAE